MKFLLFFVIFTITLALTAGKRTKEDEDRIVDDFYRKFNKNRGRTQKDFEKRRKIIIDRYDKVENHNEKFKKGKELYEQELNELSDLSDDEIAEKWTGLKVPESFDDLGNNTVPPLPEDGRRGRAAVPSSWNWALYNVVQPVQNQGGCGSCYAFAGVAAIEGSMCRYFGQCTKLSEQEAMECTRGCSGGFDTDVYTYSKNNGGVAYGSSYSYKGYITKGCAKNGARVPKSYTPNWYILPNNADTIRDFVYNYGPLWAAFYTYSSFHNYRSGIFNGCTGSNPGGHAVLITGYGESNGVKYWIIKNSWGKSWGENGYFKMLRGNNCANIESWRVSFPWTQ